MRSRRWMLWFALIVLPVALLGANTARNATGTALTSESPAARLEQLEPHWRMVPEDRRVTEAAGFALSGCDGVRDNMEFWAGLFASHDLPTLILDSHAPRNLDTAELWRLVCAGQAMPGEERAGDLAVAMAQSRRGAVVLFGASHGGWTVLEYLQLLTTGDVPPGLDAWPAPPDALMPRIARVVVLYPYCGFLSSIDEGNWSAVPPILIVASGADEIVSTESCVELADRLRERGAHIEVEVLDEIGHGFDQNERSALSPLSFDLAAREEAAELVAAFIRGGE